MSLRWTIFKKEQQPKNIVSYAMQTFFGGVRGAFTYYGKPTKKDLERAEERVYKQVSKEKK